MQQIYFHYQRFKLQVYKIQIIISDPLFVNVLLMEFVLKLMSEIRMFVIWKMFNKISILQGLLIIRNILKIIK